MDAVVEQELGPHSKPEDLFAEWRADGQYVERLAEATVLARLGGLLHDLTHVPFGHTIEDDLGLLTPHDGNLERFDFFWGSLEEDVRDSLAAGGLSKFLRPLIVSKPQGKDKTGRKRSYAEVVAALGGAIDVARQYEFVADIVGNTICADLIDYLRRDFTYSGLPLAVGHRYLASFYVTPTKHRKTFTARMVLRIERNGHTRADVVTELLKHLRYRYELSERALVHHAKLAADAMVGKALSMWRDALWIDEALPMLERAPSGSSVEDLGSVRAEVESKLGPEHVKVLDRSIEERMEREFRQRGDFGVLEWLRDWAEDSPSAEQSDEPRDRRRAGIASLTKDLINRRLFKPIAHIEQVPSGAKALYDRYKDTETRRELEQAAARFAEIRPTWQVLLWIPDPDMRLKIAEVLVETDDGIKKFVDHERQTRRGAGAEIYDAHRDLWRVSVYVEPEIRRDGTRVRAVLAWLAAELEVRISELGLDSAMNPWEAPDALAATSVTDEDDHALLKGAERRLMVMAGVQRKAEESAPAATFSGRVEEMRRAASAFAAVRSVLEEELYVRLHEVKGDVQADLYADVLSTPGYEVGVRAHARLVELFRQAANLKLEELIRG
jgi:HD superfamily phosphohydrolase